MDVGAFLAALEDDPTYAGQIVHMHTEPAKQARFADLPAGLGALPRRFLSRLGIARLYSHQAEAIDALLQGRDVLLTAGAAGGKSLCYQLPILQALSEDPTSTALLVFPSKALARDQLTAWQRGLNDDSPDADARPQLAAAYDADAARADRRAARDEAHVVVTNPEMLHVQMLPDHGRWARFFAHLRFVVLDEVHTYTGFFGANMANVMRRLERVCLHYGSRPQVVSCSATIANPKEAGDQVTGRSLIHVDGDGAARGAKTFVFWNPPRVKARRWRGRRSANVEAHELMVKLVRRHCPTIVFSKARNTAEMIYRYARDTLLQEEPALADRVAAYRGGYSPAERRDMERRLREGQLLGVSATRALELGIDVGTLEACVIVGYPGTLAAFFQQAGRAGRTGRDSLVFLVGVDTAINQYVMNHPEYVFGRPVERGVVDRDNPFVVLGHVRCATAEIPVATGETGRFGYAADFALDVLDEKKKVIQQEGLWYHGAAEAPAHEVRLRGYGDESTVVLDADTGNVIDRVDKFRAVRLFYEGGVYFHRGDTYLVERHDTTRNVALVRRADVGYYTDPVTGTSVDHVDTVLDERPLGTAKAALGEVFAVERTPLYEKVHFYTMERIRMEPADIAPVAYEAMSFWLTAPAPLAGDVARLGLNGESGMKGVLYCVSRILPLFLTSDANDFDWSLGSRNTPWHTMFWFEFYLHGIGHAEQCYERLEEILHVALEQLLTCDCEDGCPNCTSRLITPYHVRNIELGEGIVASRRAAVVVLASILTGRSAADSLALLDAPRARRGMKHLPAVTGEHRQTQPHRIPLTERTRRLMLRKLERARAARQPVDHRIDVIPPVGIPAEERDAAVNASDSEARSGRTAIRRAGDPTARRLRSSLRQRKEAAPPPPRENDGTEEPDDASRESTAPTSADTVVNTGDPLAQRARRLKRRRHTDRNDEGEHP